ASGKTAAYFVKNGGQSDHRRQQKQFAMTVAAAANRIAPANGLLQELARCGMFIKLMQLEMLTQLGGHLSFGGQRPQAWGARVEEVLTGSQRADIQNRGPYRGDPVARFRIRGDSSPGPSRKHRQEGLAIGFSTAVQGKFRQRNKPARSHVLGKQG